MSVYRRWNVRFLIRGPIAKMTAIVYDHELSHAELEYEMERLGAESATIIPPRGFRRAA